MVIRGPQALMAVYLAGLLIASVRAQLNGYVRFYLGLRTTILVERHLF
jgi:hypothetical protein